MYVYMYYICILCVCMQYIYICTYITSALGLNTATASEAQLTIAVKSQGVSIFFTATVNIHNLMAHQILHVRRDIHVLSVTLYMGKEDKRRECDEGEERGDGNRQHYALHTLLEYALVQVLPMVMTN